jgi:hypothetical protein
VGDRPGSFQKNPVPILAYIHVVIQIQEKICSGQPGHGIDRITNPCILGRPAVVNAFRPHPIEASVCTFIYMNNNLVFECRIFPDGTNAELKQVQVVPGWNEYREMLLFPRGRSRKKLNGRFWKILKAGHAFGAQLCPKS